MTKHLALAIALWPLLILAGCEFPLPEEDSAEELDPVVQQGVNEQIMVDPDLANQNEASAALTGGTDQSLPLENMTREAITTAREEALALGGGSKGFTELPAAKILDQRPPEGANLTPVSRAAAISGRADCIKNMDYSARWAARLPDVFPVYPRGATKEAAGTDGDNCALRVVTYVTPVPLDDVFMFYHSRALSAGYSSEYTSYEGENILKGTKGQSSYAVYGRSVSSGLTEIDLVTSGLIEEVLTENGE